MIGNEPVDLSGINSPEELKNIQMNTERDVYKRQVLTYSRHKSKQLIRIVVTPQMQGVIDKYNTENEYLFPIISGEYASGLSLIHISGFSNFS